MSQQTTPALIILLPVGIHLEDDRAEEGTMARMEEGIFCNLLEGLEFTRNRASQK